MLSNLYCLTAVCFLAFSSLKVTAILYSCDPLESCLDDVASREDKGWYVCDIDDDMGGKHDYCTCCFRHQYCEFKTGHCKTCPRGRYSEIRMGADGRSDFIFGKGCDKFIDAGCYHIQAEDVDAFSGSPEECITNFSQGENSNDDFEDGCAAWIDSVSIGEALSVDEAYLSDGCPHTCEAGKYSIKGDGECTSCPHGRYAEDEGSSACQMFDDGCYCGSSGCQEGAKTPCPAECPAGKYFSKSWYLGLSFWARIFKAWPYGCENVDIGCYSSGTGATDKCPEQCPPGKYRDIVGGSECTLCPKGLYTDVTGATECKKCPGGEDAPDEGMTACEKCPPGKYRDPTVWTQTGKCQDIQNEGYYSLEGFTEAQYCSMAFEGGATTNDNNNQWTGGPLREDCRCKTGRVGSNCELEKCPDASQIPLDLVDYYLLGDSKLNKFTKALIANQNSPSRSQIELEATQYLLDLLNSISTDDDMTITKTEMIAALKRKSIYSPRFESMSWSNTYPSNIYTQRYNDVINRRNGVPYFVPYVKSMESSYPDESWDDETCKAHDINWNPTSAAVKTSWVFQNPPSIDRVCMYMNGLAMHKSFKSTPQLKGQDTQVLDKEDYFSILPDGNPFKGTLNRRIYCIVISSGMGLHSQCSRGLNMDGSPIDFEADLKESGIQFTFFDTSIGEKEFHIFGGDYGSTEPQKLVVAINSASAGCGSTVAMSVYVDKINGKRVGAVMEYLIVGIQTYTNLDTKEDTLTPVRTQSTSLVYRVPYYASFEGTVVSAGVSGAGIYQATVKFRRVNPITGKLDSIAELKSVTTDKRGKYSGELKFSGPSWKYPSETWNITVVKIDPPTGEEDEFRHVFMPDYVGIEMMHQEFGLTIPSFQDNSTIAVIGTVAFDPFLIDKNVCTFPGVPLKLTDKSGQVLETFSELDGSFALSLRKGEEAILEIPSYQGHSWRSTIDTHENRGVLRRRRRKLVSSPTFSPTAGSRSPSFKPTTRSPSFKPTTSPSFKPTTRSPSFKPTTRSPSFKPTILTRSPSFKPTVATQSPSFQPTVATLSPSFSPSLNIRQQPTLVPISTGIPSIASTERASVTESPSVIGNLTADDDMLQKTYKYSKRPTSQPTNSPSIPTGQPSRQPSRQPSQQPSSQPSRRPSRQPSSQPTSSPSSQPSTRPSRQPTDQPSSMPSGQPSGQPSSRPSGQPSSQPSQQPTWQPSTQPSAQPSSDPSQQPTWQPSTQPSVQPSSDPTRQPSMVPSAQPSTRPTVQPTMIPTSQPSTVPSSEPTCQPTSVPSRLPTRQPSTQPSFAPTNPTSSPSVNAVGNFMNQVNSGSTTIEPQEVLSADFSLSSYTVFRGSSVTSEHKIEGSQIQLPKSTKKRSQYRGNEKHLENNNVVVKETTLYGVSLDNDRAIFTQARSNVGLIPKPFIQLPDNALAYTSQFTVEFWVQKTDTTSDATLFSFGTSTSSVTFPAFNFNDAKHVVVSVDFKNGRSGVYFDGVTQTNAQFAPRILMSGSNVALSYTMPKNSAFRLEGKGFIGRNLANTGSPFIGWLREFRIWYGIFDPARVYSSYIIGNVQSTIFIPSFSSYYDISANFYAKSKQDIQIGIYGGENRVQLVGSESSIRLTPQDPDCKFSLVVPLRRATSAVRKKFPAMNYTVSIEKLLVPAPQFAPGVCDQANILTSCTCGESLPLLDYFTDAKLLSQDITIFEVNGDTIMKEFVYHSAVCLEAIGGEKFSETDAESPIADEEDIACINNDNLVMKKEQTVDLTINLFERYPDSVLSPWFDVGIKDPITGLFQPKDITAQTRSPVDLNVSQSVLYIRDLVSGMGTSQSVTYNATIVPPEPPLLVGRPACCQYTIKAASPRTDFPFTWIFQLTAQRLGPEGYSIANKYWFIPITGNALKEMPNIYPVSSDPNLIFMVLRDPPGGGSFATLSQGTSATFGIEIDGMYTADKEFGYEEYQLAGASGDITKCIGYVITECTTYFEKSDHTVNGQTSGHAVSTARGSTAAYEYTFTFATDISTSADPRNAGRASDVIMGGGVTLYVQESFLVFQYRKVYYFRSLTDGQIKPRDNTIIKNPKAYQQLACFSSNMTNTWLPAKVTTFIIPVMQIDLLINKLQAKIDSYAKNGQAGNSDALKLDVHTESWRTILKNHRDRDNDLTKIFTSEDLQFRSMVAMYEKFNRYGITSKELTKHVEALDMSSILSSPVGKKDVTRSKVKSYYDMSFNRLGDYCRSILPGQRNIYLESICSDFNPYNWRTVYDLLTQSCNMPDSPISPRKRPIYVSNRMLQANESQFYNPANESEHEARKLDALLAMKNSTLFKSMCKIGDVSKENDKEIRKTFPGGVSGSLANQRAFDFLKEPKTKILTFYAGAPMTFTWTGSVSDSVSFTSSLSEGFTAEAANGFDAAGSIGGIPYVPLQIDANFGFSKTKLDGRTVDIGKTASTGHDFERTVTVVLDDPDPGDMFAVRVTEDPVYGTPVFTAMGGASRCVGETGTSRRENNVKIISIAYRCGPTHDLPCNPATLFSPDEEATFAVQILNLSPTSETAWMSLDFSKTADRSYNSGAYSEDPSKKGFCGTDEQRSGLIAKFSATDLEVPFNQLVEVPFTVKMSGGSLCYVYNKVGITLEPTCEAGDFETFVYQYQSVWDSVKGVVNADYENLMDSASEGFFSVTWPKTATPRYLANNLEVPPANEETITQASEEESIRAYLNEIEFKVDILIPIVAVCVLFISALLTALIANLKHVTQASQSVVVHSPDTQA